MSSTTTTAIAIYPNNTQAEEDVLAASLVGQTAGASVIFNTDLDLARIWNGTAFENTPTPITDSNQKIIRQLSDFPAPVAGVITVEDNNAYLITGTVDISPNRIVCGIKNTFTGNDRQNDKLISDTTGALFTLDSSVIPKLSFITDTLTLECPNGSILDVSGGLLNSVTLITTTIANTKSLGTVNQTGLSIRTCSINNLTTSGLVFTGANTSLILRDSTISNNAGTFFDLSSCSAISAIGVSRSYVTTNATQTFLNATGIVVSLNGQINLCSFAGAGTQLTGVTESTLNWLMSNNIGITNTPTGGGSGLTQAQVEGLI